MKKMLKINELHHSLKLVLNILGNIHYIVSLCKKIYLFNYI